MLNRLFEKGVSKCEMYYPNVDEDNSELSVEYGKFRLNYLSELPFEDFAIRTIECENIEQKEKRIVYHCHYTNWPDFGEPEYTTSFLNFLNECNKFDIFNTALYGPSVIHCSAGVGRSGTFVLVDSFIELYKMQGNELRMSVSELLLQMRTYRMGLVQTHQQLKFAYMSIIDAIKKIRFENESLSSQILDPSSLRDDNPNYRKISFSKIANNSFSSSEDDDDERPGNAANENNSTLARPSTGKYDRRKEKHTKLSKETENHVKNLREIQFKNKNQHLHSELANDFESENVYSASDINLMLKTAVNNRTSFESQSNNATNLKLDLKSNSDSDSDDEDDLIDEINTDDFLNSDESDEKPFATSRNISTVIVNQKRRPLDPSMLPKLDLVKENEPTNSVDENASKASSLVNDVLVDEGDVRERAKSPKTVSEREKRVSELVNSIKQKQKQHEQKKKFYDDFRPILMGGGLFLGGVILHQLYKAFISK